MEVLTGQIKCANQGKCKIQVPLFPTAHLRKNIERYEIYSII